MPPRVGNRLGEHFAWQGQAWRWAGHGVAIGWLGAERAARRGLKVDPCPQVLFLMLSSTLISRERLLDREGGDSRERKRETSRERRRRLLERKF